MNYLVISNNDYTITLKGNTANQKESYIYLLISSTAS